MRPIESHSDFVSTKLATILVLREEIAPTKGSGSKFSFDISRQELDRWLKNIRSSRSGEWRAHVRRVESVRNETVQGKRYPLWKRTTGAPEGTAESHWNSRMYAYASLWTRNSTLLVLHGVNGPVSNHHEERTIEPRPFDAEFTSIFISVACLSQKFISIRERQQQKREVVFSRLAFLLTTRRSLLEISSAAINILILSPISHRKLRGKVLHIFSTLEPL